MKVMLRGGERSSNGKLKKRHSLVRSPLPLLWFCHIAPVMKIMLHSRIMTSLKQKGISRLQAKFPNQLTHVSKVIFSVSRVLRTDDFRLLSHDPQTLYTTCSSEHFKISLLFFSFAKLESVPQSTRGIHLKESVELAMLLRDGKAIKGMRTGTNIILC